MSPLAGWPVDLSGVTESVVTTLGPNDRWNVAALGLLAPDRHGGEGVRAVTWGRTRTWRNFTERGEGIVQFTRDPVDFVEAACSVYEQETPVLESADAWVRVTVTELESSVVDGTLRTEWALSPVEASVERRVVPTTNRAAAALVEATVAASRLEVPGYDTDELRGRIEFLERVVDSCGGPRERRAWERFDALVDWRADE